jgi:hypothetical protein
MSKVQEYLKKKKIQQLGLPKLYVVKSSPEGVEPPNSGDKIDGKPIILLTETECQVYLKQAIDGENYDIAEKIRKQMEKYR